MSSLPHLDECRYLILKVIEQTVRDFLSLEKSATPLEQFHYETARDLLFDDNYTIDWGGTDKTLQDLTDIVNIDLKWLRLKVMKLKNLRIKKITLNRIIHEETDSDY